MSNLIDFNLLNGKKIKIVCQKMLEQVVGKEKDLSYLQSK
jgi:hypothetical protein